MFEVEELMKIMVAGYRKAALGMVTSQNERVIDKNSMQGLINHVGRSGTPCCAFIEADGLSI
jgi:hypothetical protein